MTGVSTNIRKYIELFDTQKLCVALWAAYHLFSCAAKGHTTTSKDSPGLSSKDVPQRATQKQCYAVQRAAETV